MAKLGSRGPKQHSFRNKLLLKQWLVSLGETRARAEGQVLKYQFALSTRSNIPFATYGRAASTFHKHYH
ncbi:MAG: hypothetical protein HW415_2017 [Deltaproteobacteria bacterium]|nr:hypothetical protein [Deltaproteobacteria bacterium]